MNWLKAYFMAMEKEKAIVELLGIRELFVADVQELKADIEISERANSEGLDREFQLQDKVEELKAEIKQFHIDSHGCYRKELNDEDADVEEYTKRSTRMGEILSDVDLES